VIAVGFEANFFVVESVKIPASRMYVLENGSKDYEMLIFLFFIVHCDTGRTQWFVCF
jgi:hypothetical protein